MHIQATLPSRVQMFLVTGTSIISAVNLGKMLLCHCLVSPRNFYPWELCQAVFPVPEMEMNVIFWKITACGYVLFHRKLLPYQGFFLQCIFQSRHSKSELRVRSQHSSSLDSQDHRMAWGGRDTKDYPIPLPLAETLFATQGHSEPHTT